MPRIINEEYEQVDVRRLKTHSRNARQGDIGSIHESITENGFYGACVVQKSTSTVLVGNHRLMAAKQAGLDTVPVIWVDVDDDEALRILLADNRTNDVASYDDNKLAELLADLAGTERGLAGTGFSPESLDDIIQSLAGPVFEPASIDEQGRLDEKAKVECPECGHSFSPS